MARFLLDDYTGKDSYSDGDIEDTIYKIVKGRQCIWDLTDQELSYPVIYHLSEVRKNILLWYPFSSHASLLEIGSGCGAVTGLFCEKVKQVTSVELSKRRAGINYERNKKYKNLDILAADVFQVNFEQKFDYIVINGVFEYAASFVHGDKPYQEFLVRVKKMLSENGTILLAIENRLGAKYFAGAPEDHTDLYFKGINGYDGINSVRTFSKQELTELVQSAGLSCTRFYYPYPDYKFPSEIFTDETIHTGLYGKEYFQFSDQRIELLKEPDLNQVFAREKVADKFANSFLVEISHAKKQAEQTGCAKQIEYVKLNTDRNEPFQIYTMILNRGGTKLVRKIPLHDKSQAHIQHMKNVKDSENKNWLFLPPHKDTENDGSLPTLEYDYIDSQSLDAWIVSSLQNQKSDQIAEAIESVFQTFLTDSRKLDPYQDSRFAQVFGEKPWKNGEYRFLCVRDVNLDLILDNLFYKDGKMVVIDYEWVFPFAIPSEYIMWRMINELYCRHPQLYGLVEKRKLESRYGITETNSPIFRSWEMEFAYHYVGSSKLKRAAKEPYSICMEKIIEREKYAREVESTLYIDDGSGFSEQNTKKFMLNLDKGMFEAEVSLNDLDGEYLLRWDPAQRPCICSDLEIYADGRKIGFHPLGALMQETEMLFLDHDPIILLDQRLSGIHKLLLKGKFSLPEEEGLFHKIRQLDQLCMRHEEKIRSQRQLCEEQESKLAELQKIREEQDAERNWQQQFIESLEVKISTQQKELTKRTKELGQKEYLLEKNNRQIIQQEKKLMLFQKELAAIKNSKIWNLYKLKDRIMHKNRDRVCSGEDSSAFDEIHYTIDSIDYHTGRLHIRGWAFIKDITPDRVCVEVECQNETAQQELYNYGLERPDVQAAFQGGQQALQSGFHAEFDLKFSGEAVVSLVISVRDKTCKLKIIRLQEPLAEQKLEFRPYIKSLAKDMELIANSVERKDDPMKRADVIVPIYNGYAYLEKLLEGLTKTRIPAHYILIDDNSTDQRVGALLKQFAREQKNVELIFHEKNVGFVRTVNEGLRKARADAAIVNTDVELPFYWLERLMAPIFENETIASSTPFSNSAAIFSFPEFTRNNRIYRGMEVEALDRYFAKIKPQYTTVPTGMGFCMGMSKKAVQEIGVLDEKTFGRGYGEENDWCQRARKAGYVNVQVENLFVYHKHGGSFDTGEKKKLLEDHMKKLSRKYPEYLADVARYCENDPVKRIRNLIRILIDTDRTDTENILVFDHGLGGGASSYINKKIIVWEKQGKNVFLVSYNLQEGDYRCVFRNECFTESYTMAGTDELFQIFEIIRLDKIYVNELVGYPHVPRLLDMIKSLAEKTGSSIKVPIHDYFPVCPSVNLIALDGNYCKEGGRFDCASCFQAHQWDKHYGCADITQWRNRWRDFLSECSEIRTFSADSLQRIRCVFGNMEQLTLVPHQVDYMPVVHRKRKRTDTLNIGLLGTLSEHKGKTKIKELLALIQTNKIYEPVKFLLIGSLDREDFCENEHFEATGSYQIEQLPQLVLEKDIDLFFIASTWPETFSYTTEEIIKMDMPVAALALGAPAERIAAYPKGMLLQSAGGEDLLRELLSFAKRMEIPYGTKQAQGSYVLFVAEYLSYASRYRVEHTQEQLLLQGIRSRFLQPDELEQITEWEQVGAVVIYRCRYREPLAGFIRKVKGTIPLLYDIDDYIFDYNEISGLAFLKGAEYADFKQESQELLLCMEQCDRFLASTDTLAGKIAEKMQKPVFVNRNTASMAMQVLSNIALLQKKQGQEQDEERVVLGYFSGSRTHDTDFALIEDIILDLMGTYAQLELLVVGCLELSEKFGAVEERVVRKDFVDWQKLPSLIAGVDINLMPLEDTLFNRCKSENKWMEAALVKTPTVASFNEEIAGVASDGYNILLCKNQDEWRKQLICLIESETMRRDVAQHAYCDVLAQKTTGRVDCGLGSYIFEGKFFLVK